MSPGLRVGRRILLDLVKAALRPVFRLGTASLHSLTGRVRPLAGHGNHAIVLDGASEEVPPVALWEDYGDSAAEYLASGQRDMARMMAVLNGNGVEEGGRILDLGCAAGRMLRHYPSASAPELWGADISTAHILWAQANLPQANFVTTSTAPHLPFEDRTFDLVYCGSVFTHIADLADAWLLEIRRVLKAGGHAYFTLHDRESYRYVLTEYHAKAPDAFSSRAAAFERRHQVLGRRWKMFFFGSEPGAQVFYERDYIVEKWSRWMDVVEYQEMVHDYQAAILLRKRAAP